MRPICDNRGARIIGIAGGIGAGKSVVCRLLRIRGYEVYDCDIKAKELMALEPLASEIASLLGAEAFTDNGALDRGYVASRIFSDAEVRRQLNALVHSAVVNDVERIAGTMTAKDLLFVESAVMVTSGLDELASQIWVVDAPVDLRIRRVLARNPELNEEDILRRMQTQEKELEAIEEFKRREICNSGEISLLRQVDALLVKLEE